MRKTGIAAVRALLGDVQFEELKNFWRSLTDEEKVAFGQQAEVDPRVNPS